MQKPFSYSSAAAVAALLLLTACNGNSSNNNNGFGTNCGGPVQNMQLIHPINGASKVNPAIQAIFVSTSGALAIGNQYNFLIVQSSGAQQFTSTFARYTGTIPSPHSSPPPGSTIYETVIPQPIGPLQSSNLYWNDGGTGCTPNVIVGSFTTGLGTAAAPKR
ncbi:MAG TPA: hypothetical protein VGK84_05815 [Candidatus Tumulicola sp.]|jgi:hypothetical protein